METVIGPVVATPGPSQLLVVDEQSQIGAARRSAVALGHTHALSAEAIGRLAIVVTEAATNIVRYGGGGVIVLRGLVGGPSAVIELLALDKGPGIPSIPRAMQDGHSTSGTAGQGLGAIRRLSQLFEIYSLPLMGTALLSRIGEAKGHTNRNGAATSLDDRVGAISVPLRGETQCGDAWRIVANRRRVSVLLVDGLGHGPHAAVAAAVATTTFAQLGNAAPEAALAAFHKAMRGTRGAALSIAIIDEGGRTMLFGGVGNVDGRVIAADATEHLVPQNGIVGHTMPNVRPLTAAWPDEALLVMHSDGISARWRLDAYPGLMKAHPALIAGVIYRDFGRPRDDATVLVLGADPAATEKV
jgi:anti-sigma regulatory factor (Ser/Thr protein kinase)